MDGGGREVKEEKVSIINNYFLNNLHFVVVVVYFFFNIILNKIIIYIFFFFFSSFSFFFFLIWKVLIAEENKWKRAWKMCYVHNCLIASDWLISRFFVSLAWRRIWLRFPFNYWFGYIVYDIGILPSWRTVIITIRTALGFWTRPRAWRRPSRALRLCRGMRFFFSCTRAS